MKKLLSLACSFSLLWPALLTPGAATTGIEAGVPRYSVGDLWTYSVKDSPDDYTIKVAKTNVRIQNETCYEMHYQVIAGGPVAWICWNRVSDLALVTEMDPDTNHAVYYEPPVKEFDFPLHVGKGWTATYTSYTSGNGGDRTFKENRTERFYVDREEDVMVTAGTFRCLRIANVLITGEPVYRWYSPKVGAYVNEANIRELKNYSFNGTEKAASNGPGQMNNSLVIATIPLLLAAAAVIVSYMIIKNRRRHAR